MIAQDRKLPAPEPNPETQPFGDAAARGQLLLKRCTACGERHYYPRAICPFCFSDKTAWKRAAGTGKMNSYSVLRRTTVPSAITYVILAESVTMLTNIAAC